ncbi:MAG: M48 family metalloprotease [Rhodospirillaceae bacterium]
MRKQSKGLVKADSLLEAVAAAVPAGGSRLGGRAASLMLALGLVLGLTAGAGAQNRGPKLDFIRDAEVEHIIRGYARPIFKVAGIDPEAVDIILVKEDSINAFVAGGQNLFIHTGLLMECDNPEQLVGVIAHESGHIAGGHLFRGRDAMENASAEAMVAMVLGVGAAILSRQGGAMGAIGLGGADIAMRNYLAFSRTQEASADQAGLTFLDRAHISTQGFYDFLQKLSGQELLPSSHQASYTRTHPLTRERIDAVADHLQHSAWKSAHLPASDVEQFARLKAKLIGFIRPAVALRRYPADNPSVAARYARAIAYYQQGDLRNALPAIDKLIAQEPRNPFFHELKGQALMENQRLAESLVPYRKAVDLLPDSGLLRGSLAQALIEINTPVYTEEALKHLDFATRQERDAPMLWRLVATAWGRKNNDGMVAYALAEEALARGDRSAARFHSEHAEKLLPRGSPGWLRAQDIHAVADDKRGER